MRHCARVQLSWFVTFSAVIRVVREVVVTLVRQHLLVPPEQAAALLALLLLVVSSLRENRDERANCPRARLVTTCNTTPRLTTSPGPAAAQGASRIPTVPAAAVRSPGT